MDPRLNYDDQQPHLIVELLRHILRDVKAPRGHYVHVCSCGVRWDSHNESEAS